VTVIHEYRGKFRVTLDLLPKPDIIQYVTVAIVFVSVSMSMNMEYEW
jgi:hypothetical protein